MFEDEGPHGVGVALCAHRELPRGGAHLVARLRPVRVMTVAALYESDIDAVPVRPGELSPLRGVASVAQVRLRLLQHEIDISRTVRAMAGRAADAIRQMFGLGKVLRFQAGLVTFRADCGRLRRTQGLKANDLGDVAATVHVGLPRTMTTLASVLVPFKQRGVRSAGKVLVPHFLWQVLQMSISAYWPPVEPGSAGDV